MKYKRVLLFYILFFTGVALAFGFGYMARVIQDTAKPSELPLLSEAYKLLKENAYDELPKKPVLQYGMIRGMLDAFGDPYSSFSEPAQAELYNDQLSGKYGGIGASMELDPQGYIVLHPFSDSPAAAAGILDGDRLIRVNDWIIEQDSSLDEVVAAIRGPEGEFIIIEIARSTALTHHTFEIKRQDIPIPSVTWHIDVGEPRMGIVQINTIADSTTDEIQNAVDDLQSRGATHFVFDLRNNGGGLLQAGVDIARLFLKDGNIIQEHYRDQEVKTYEVKKPGPLAEIPMVVLVNENTASASEIIAGSIQMQDRAPIIGTPTYGKDTIQLVFSLQDGSSLHITAAKWWVPGLNPVISDGGIQPDILVSDEIEGDPYMQAALQTLFK